MAAKKMTVEEVEKNASMPGGIGLAGEDVIIWKIKLIEKTKGAPETGGGSNSKYLLVPNLSVKIATNLGFPLSLTLNLTARSTSSDGDKVKVFYPPAIRAETLSGNLFPSEVYVNFKWQCQQRDSHLFRTYGSNCLKRFSLDASYRSIISRNEGSRLFDYRGDDLSLPLDEEGNLLILVHVKIYADKSFIEMAQAKSNFRRNISQNFASLLENPEDTGANITIVSKDGKEFRVHKFVLVNAGIEAFKSMVTCGMVESQTGVIKLDHLSSEAIKFLLHYIYSGDLLPFNVKIEDQMNEQLVRMSKEEEKRPCISELLHAAHMYMIQELLDFFDRIIGHMCDADNVAFLLGLANKYCLKKAKEAINTLVKNDDDMLKNVLDIV